MDSIADGLGFCTTGPTGQPHRGERVCEPFLSLTSSDDGHILCFAPPPPAPLEDPLLSAGEATNAPRSEQDTKPPPGLEPRPTRPPPTHSSSVPNLPKTFCH